MDARHPHLRYRREDTWAEARLRDRLIAQAQQMRDGRWVLAWVAGLDWRAFEAMVAFARPYAWRHDHKPYGNPIAKGLRKRPT